MSTRRSMLLGAATWAAAACGLLGRAAAQPAPRTIDIVARRFVYEPNEIELKVGERVVVNVRSLDFVHGMNIPDLGKRFDLTPGKITSFEIEPSKPGPIDFVCDNFCGDGHEEMHGRFVVR